MIGMGAQVGVVHRALYVPVGRPGDTGMVQAQLSFLHPATLCSMYATRSLCIPNF